MAKYKEKGRSVRLSVCQFLRQLNGQFKFDISSALLDISHLLLKERISSSNQFLLIPD
ncbi:hypothetical protein TTHERM_00126960 (macronuclear) [Tetrahymena thermophila SB210]|uniref:Uncharacterized protein n=1 Tax=Tetrahymena thermophila (strain SB210) TaxID=312017 RepID=I7LUT9_TETTS|nr:hypothetical protein TTHERM_00126960 [Tetrahymena thermophila SB210]EAR96031.1 hypothetical protein TTHERM_00126960 [Tetrahymena thermophila SB210]|eukprot:XP_001016276.1 hypothetical protein TTHERM_00126960 [Tetrahymena thermophila SB210]